MPSRVHAALLALCLAPLPAAAGPHGDLAEEIALTFIDRNPAEELSWGWKNAVLMIGMQAAQEASGDREMAAYIAAWIDHWLEEGYRIHSSDTTVPATSALWLWHATGDARYLAPAEDARVYLSTKAPRLSDTTLAHATLVPNQAWVDSLFMAGTFWTWDARYAGQPLDEIAGQFELFHGHLWSEGARLYWHMYDEAIDAHIPVSPTFWGRGNGWALASLALLLTQMPATHPDRAALADLLRAHAQGAMDTQEADGMWHTVLNRPDSYEETSATALLSFGLLRGAHLGILGPDARAAGLRGLDGVEAHVERDETGAPVVTDISLATNPGPYAYYAHIPVGEDEPYGIGAVLLALIEGDTP